MHHIQRFMSVEPNENILSNVTRSRKLTTTDNGSLMDPSTISKVPSNSESDYNCNKEAVGENVGLLAVECPRNERNQGLSPNPQSPVSSFIQESGEFQWCLDYGCSKDFMESYEDHPTSIFSFDENQTSYDDLSKNIDVNLAEIDMETFRSEDINSILSLPALYGESFTSGTEELPNTSDSYSSGGKMETITHSTSEESSEISIYKNEPLFSPVKEPEMKLGAMSTDSLDYCTLEKHEMALTCQALKNNYTIAFEGSGTQLSDDSNTSGKMRNIETFARGSMIQSDIGFTTWSKVQKVKNNKMYLVPQNASSGKSCSLPSLATQEMIFSSALQFHHGPEPVLLYNIHSSQSVSSQDSSNYSPRSLSLLKLYMQHKDGSNLTSSDSVSDSSVSSPQKHKHTHVITNISDMPVKSKNMYHTPADKKEKEFLKLNNSKEFIEKGKLSNCDMVINASYALITDTPLVNETENNNNICTVTQNKNLEIIKQRNENEEDNSLYFEDSLMEVTPPKIKPAYASPIKEEEEPFEFSSGEETMRESKDLFLTDSKASVNKCLKKNKSANTNSTELSDLKCIKVKNVFGNEKFASLKPNSSFKQSSNDLITENNSQATQTKFTYQKNCDSNIHNSSCHKRFIFLKTVNSSNSSVETAGNSFGNLNPVSGCTCTSQQSILPLKRKVTESSFSTRKSNVIITRTCHNSTQIPVHIKDKAIQTSLTEDCIFRPLKEDFGEPTNTINDDQGNLTKKSFAAQKAIYVYYPNYSLPDLSFLKSTQSYSDNADPLNSLQQKGSNGEKALLKRRARSSEGRCRPKSYNCESLCPVNPIKDWDSLSILLPENVKGIIRPMKEHVEAAISSHSNPPKEICIHHAEDPPPLPKRSLSLCQKAEEEFAHPRSILRKSVNCSSKHNQSVKHKSVSKQNTKRWSLQEPLFWCNVPRALHNMCLSSSEDHTKHMNVYEAAATYNSNNNKKTSQNCLVPHSDLHTNESQTCNFSPDQVPCLRSPVHSNNSCHQCKCSTAHSDEKCFIHNESHISFGNQRGTELSFGKDAGFDYGFDEVSPIENECPPQEFLISPSHCSQSTEESSFPIMEIENTIWLRLVNTKSVHFQTLKKAVEEILRSTSDLKEFKIQVNSIAVNPVELFCEALYGIFTDGLHTSVPELPDSLSESIWHVVQISVLQDCKIKALQKLVQKICKQATVEKKLKFHGYILGLLNCAWLDVWLTQFFSCTKTIRQYYRPTSLLYLLTFPLAVDLQKQMLHIVEPLKEISFNLELNLVFPHNLNCKTDYLGKEAQFDLQLCNHKSSDRSPDEIVTWSGITVYPFSQCQPEEVKKTEFSTFHSNNCNGCLESTNHKHVAPNRKTKTLRDMSTNEKMQNTDFSADSGCSSEISHQIPKDEVPRFQQLRQRWEKLTCPEDAVSSSKHSRTLPSKPFEINTIDDFDHQKHSKLTCQKTTKKLLDEEQQPDSGSGIAVSGRRRSLIPVHKGNKAISNRRSGSAPSERGQR